MGKLEFGLILRQAEQEVQVGLEVQVRQEVAVGLEAQVEQEVQVGLEVRVEQEVQALQLLETPLKKIK